MIEKGFRIAGRDIQRLTPHAGACFATDRITVDGERVGYMYRQKAAPGSNVSGWTFLSGTESQEYLDKAANIGIYSVNTIANYDPDIIPFLDAPFGSAFARDAKTGKSVAADAPPED